MIESAKKFFELRNSEDPDQYLRAANEEAKVSIWEDVIATYPEMREWVAHNKTIPESIIRKLSSDPDSKVRYIIASRRKTPDDVKEMLSKDEDESVRMAIANNKKTSKKILEGMLNDDWKNIVDIVQRRLIS